MPNTTIILCYSLQVETLEGALASERQKNSDDRLALNRSHGEISRLKKELQELKDRRDQDSQNSQYYEVKVGLGIFFFFSSSL